MMTTVEQQEEDTIDPGLTAFWRISAAAKVMGVSIETTRTTRNKKGSE